VAELRFVPRYYEIEQVLRERIDRLRPGDRLPSDAMLCEEFAVSRMTARNAVARLAQEGLVQRVPGRGTFVAEPTDHRQADRLLSFSEEMRRRGRHATADLLGLAERRADEHEAERLRLGGALDVIVLERLRRADGEPIALERAVLPAAAAPAIRPVDWTEASLHAVLHGAGIHPCVGHATITAQAASAADARHLGVPRNSALLVEERLILDGRGAPVELTETRYVGARYGLDVLFDVASAPDR
jgi:DNA-binding GntR family transcriptional regulator